MTEDDAGDERIINKKIDNKICPTTETIRLILWLILSDICPKIAGITTYVIPYALKINPI